MILRMFSIGRSYRQAGRYKEIASVLAKHGFGDLLRMMGFARRRRRTGDGINPPVDIPLSRIMRLRMVFEELGPAFVKLGQTLSTRHDIVPPELIEELEKLQDSVPPISEGEAVKIIEEDLGKSVSLLFESFEQEPLASASIGQVHEAVTHDGFRVVVKVRRPDIQEMVETDLQIMGVLAALMEQYIPESKVFEPLSVVREFTRLIRSELDFGTEASRIERAASLFAGNPRVHVPEVHRELCSQRVLTMEYIDGVKISNVKEIARLGLNIERIVENCSEILFQQIFSHGFFHSDPHPGNILVMKGNVVCLLDYGQMGSLSSRQREDLSQLVFGLVSHDEHRVAEAVFRLSNYDAMENHAKVESEILKFNEDRMYRPLKEMQIGPLLADLSRILVQYNIHMPAEFFVVCKCLSTFDGVVRKILPDFNAVEFAAPFAKKLIGKRIGLRRLLRDAMDHATELYSLMRRTPNELRETLSLLKRGEIKIEAAQPGFAKASNQHALSMLVAASIIASAILLHSGSGPKWNEIPVTGLAAATLSLLGGLALLTCMLRHGKF